MKYKFWKYWCLVCAILNGIFVAVNPEWIINWIALIFSAIGYVTFRSREGLATSIFEIPELPYSLQMENFGSAMALLGWCASNDKYISNKPFLEFSPMAFHSAPDSIKSISKRNSKTGCYEVWL